MSIIDAESPRAPSVILEENEVPAAEVDHLLESGSEADTHNVEEPPRPESPSVIFSTPVIKRKVIPIKGIHGVSPITLFDTNMSDHDNDLSPPKTPEYRTPKIFESPLKEAPEVSFKPTPWQTDQEKVKRQPKEKSKKSRKPKLEFPTLVPLTIPEEMDFDISTYKYLCPFKQAGITTYSKNQNDTNVEEIMEIEENTPSNP